MYLDGDRKKILHAQPFATSEEHSRTQYINCQTSENVIKNRFLKHGLQLDKKTPLKSFTPKPSGQKNNLNVIMYV